MYIDILTLILGPEEPPTSERTTGTSERTTYTSAGTSTSEETSTSADTSPAPPVGEGKYHRVYLSCMTIYLGEIPV